LNAAWSLKVTFLHGTLLVAGISLIAWGLPAAHRLKRPFDSVAALAVLVGVIAGLIGTLLVTVPDFFKG
jgi:uncharacterized membrane protein